MQQQKVSQSIMNSMPQHPVPYARAGQLQGRNAHQSSIGIQTDFRENAVQTDPWSAPLCDAAQGPEHAELRSLVELTFQNGLLPPHQKTMEVIQRIKDQQDFDARIPPPLDPTRKVGPRELQQEELRMKMLVERDLNEWKRKENEVAHIQSLRIQQLVTLLSEREAATAEARTEILDRLALRQETEAQRLHNRLAQTRVLELKKSAADYNQSMDRTKVFNQIHTYSDRLVNENFRGEPQLQLPQQRISYLQTQATIHGSNPLNAPILKPGEAPYRFAGVIRLAGTDLKTQRDFDEIMEFMNQDSSLKPEIAEPHRPKVKQMKNYAVDLDDIEKIMQKQERWKAANSKFADKEQRKRMFTLPGHLPPPETAPAWQRGNRRQKIEDPAKIDLEDEQAIQDLEALVQSNMKDGKMLTREEKNEQVTTQQSQLQQLQAKNRVLPHSFQEVPNQKNNKINQAALYLQNLVRGVAAQVRLEAGKNRRIGLVQELRLAHELVQTRQSSENIQMLFKQRLAAIRDALTSGQVLSGAANVLGSTVDQLAKNRLRQQQIFRAEAILQIAMRERARRENLEAHQREKENLQRARTDYHQKIIQNAHRELVDMIAARSANHAVEADAEARSMELALREVDALVELDFQKSKADVPGSLQDFMYGFLLPEVDRRFMIQKFQKEQEKWILAGNLAREVAQVDVNNGAKIDDLGVLQNGDQTVPFCMDKGDQAGAAPDPK